jgi:hypothetical protein
MPSGTSCLSRVVCVLSLNRPGSGTLEHWDSKPQALARRPASPRLALCSRPAREPAVRSPPARTTGPTLEASAQQQQQQLQRPRPSPASPFPVPPSRVARRCTRSSKRRWWPCWFHPEGCAREAAWPPAPAMAGSGGSKNIPNTSTSVHSCLPACLLRRSERVHLYCAPSSRCSSSNIKLPQTASGPMSNRFAPIPPRRPNVRHARFRAPGRRTTETERQALPVPSLPSSLFLWVLSSHVSCPRKCSISLSPPGRPPAALRSNRAHPPSPATGQISARASIKPAHITCRTSLTLRATAPWKKPPLEIPMPSS